MDDSARIITTILLASFAIDRTVACIGFLLDHRAARARGDEESLKTVEKQKRQIWLFLLGGALAAVVVVLADVRILRLLRQAPNPILDGVLTWLVIVAGADRIRAMMQGVQGPPPPPKKEVVLVVDGATVKPS